MSSWSGGRALLLRSLWGIPVVVTLRDCLLCPHLIDGRGMQPALNANIDQGRDLVLVFKFGVLRYKYERGAVYLLRSPEHPRKLLTKRLIGLEGDWVAVPGEVSIHRIEKRLHSSHTSSAMLQAESGAEQGFCWVEGDSLTESEDSRTRYGQVPISLIEGKVVTILWPPSRVGAVLSAVPPDRLLITNPNAYQTS